jgi:hypothetical protein
LIRYVSYVSPGTVSRPFSDDFLSVLGINQGDNAERSIQVGLMAELYKKAKHVIVWLGPEDKSSRICKEWLIANEMTLPTLPNAHKAVIGNPEYRPSWRFLILQDTFLKPDADPIFATAIAQFWARPWYVPTPSTLKSDEKGVQFIFINVETDIVGSDAVG